MNTPTPPIPRTKVTRVDFFASNDFAVAYYFGQAVAFRRSWWNAKLERTPRSVLRYLRSLMREKALEAVKRTRELNLRDQKRAAKVAA